MGRNKQFFHYFYIFGGNSCPRCDSLYRWLWPPRPLAFCSGTSSLLAACSPRVKCSRCWASAARRPSAEVCPPPPGKLSDRYSFSAQIGHFVHSQVECRFPWCLFPVCWYLGIKTEGFCGFPHTQEVKNNVFHSKIKSFLSWNQRKEDKSTKRRPIGSVSVRQFCAHLCNKLDDFDKDVERHVSRHHTARAFGEKCRYNGVEAAVGKIQEKLAHVVIHNNNKQQTMPKKKLVFPFFSFFLFLKHRCECLLAILIQ